MSTGVEKEVEERLWDVKVSVLVKATTEEEAKEKTRKGYLLVDDVVDVEPADLEHLTGEAHEKMTKKIFDILTRVEENPATEW